MLPFRPFFIVLRCSGQLFLSFTLITELTYLWPKFNLRSSDPTNFPILAHLLQSRWCHWVNQYNILKRVQRIQSSSNYVIKQGKRIDIPVRQDWTYLPLLIPCEFELFLSFLSHGDEREHIYQIKGCISCTWVHFNLLKHRYYKWNSTQNRSYYLAE